jgi:hypothetical protein
MKPKSNKTNQLSNVSATTTKTNGSPNLKENTQAISAKYINLLKPKKESGSKQKILYPNTLNLEPSSSHSVFTKTLNRTSQDGEHNSSFTKVNPKQTREKSAKTTKQSDPVPLSQTRTNLMNINLLKCNERDGLFGPPPKSSDTGFRSPPVAHKNLAVTLLTNGFHSGGKLNIPGNMKKDITPITPLSNTHNPVQKLLLNNGTSKMLASPPKNNDSQSMLLNSNALSLSLLLNPTVPYKGTYIAFNDKVKINSHCLIHQEKKSKFYAKSLPLDTSMSKHGVVRGFCSKCAITLVKNGIECDEWSPEEPFSCNCLKNSNGEPCVKCMPSNPPALDSRAENLTPVEIQRKDRIAVFWNDLFKNKEACVQTIDALSKKRKENEFGYENQLKELNGYFTELYNALEAKRARAVGQIEKIHDSNLTKLNDYISIFEDTLKEYEVMYSDISDNYRNIIMSIESQAFNNVLKQYRQKIQQFDNLVNEVDSLQLSSTQVTFGRPVEAIKTAFDPRIQISLKSNPAIQHKKIDLDESNKQNSITDDNGNFMDSEIDLPAIEMPSNNRPGSETFRSSKGNMTKSDVYISFDPNNSGGRLINVHDSYQQDFDDTFEYNRHGDQTKEFGDILKKIDKTQNQCETFYNKLIDRSCKVVSFPISNRESEKFDHSVIESEERVFEIESRPDNEDWEQKQTPDLCEKQSPPDHIAEHLKKISQAHGSKSDNILPENLHGSEATGYSKYTCQKVLFNEM